MVSHLLELLGEPAPCPSGGVQPLVVLENCKEHAPHSAFVAANARVEAIVRGVVVVPSGLLQCFRLLVLRPALPLRPVHADETLRNATLAPGGAILALHLGLCAFLAATLQRVVRNHDQRRYHSFPTRRGRIPYELGAGCGFVGSVVAGLGDLRRVGGCVAMQV